MAASRRKPRSARHRRRRHVLVAGTAVFQGGPSHYAAQYRALERLKHERGELAAAAARTDAARCCAPARRRRCASGGGAAGFIAGCCKGRMPDHIVFIPGMLRPAGWRKPMRCCAAASASTAQQLEVRDGISVFDLPPPSRDWAEALHGFAWLPRVCPARAARLRGALATNLIAQWLRRHGRYSEPAWLPHVMARRLANIFSHGRLVIVEFRDDVALAPVRVAARASRMLERISDEAPDGLPRLEAAAVLALSGLCLDEVQAPPGPAWRGWKRKSRARSCPMAAMSAARPRRCCVAYRHLVDGDGSAGRGRRRAAACPAQRA